MKEIDATRLKLKALELVEGAAIPWTDVIRYHDRAHKNNVSSANFLAFGGYKDDYELALGIVEGKPVWEGDRYYFHDTACIATGSCKQIYWDKCTWNKPKPKTITVELPLETVEFLASFDIHGSDYMSILTLSCRDALEKQTDQIKYKSSHGGSITGCLRVPGFDHTGATSK